MRKSMEQGLTSLTLMAMKTKFDKLHDQDLDMQGLMRNHMSFLSEMIGDTMYFHQAMNQPDADDFVKAIVKEINGHIERNHWKLTPCDQVPEGTNILHSLWSMKRKFDLVSKSITKYKARLNLHRG